MPEKKNRAFNFGINWKKFSEKSLDETKFIDASDSLGQLIGKNIIKGKSFIDIGCGSGLFSISASKAGAKKVTGIDISKESLETSLNNKERFIPGAEITFLHKSIFDKDVLELGKFDIVYSWGVLHHTGDMWRAIDLSSKLVNRNGLFVIAIYNKHRSSPLWKIIKWFYNISPKFIQWFMIQVFYWVIAIAKFVATGKNPFSQKRRGMNFYYDVIDWVGGYPYEYASKCEIEKFVEEKGFKLKKFVKSTVPTGCNEFVFIKS